MGLGDEEFEGSIILFLSKTPSKRTGFYDNFNKFSSETLKSSLALLVGILPSGSTKYSEASYFDLILASYLF